MIQVQALQFSSREGRLRGNVRLWARVKGRGCFFVTGSSDFADCGTLRCGIVGSFLLVIPVQAQNNGSNNGWKQVDPPVKMLSIIGYMR
jgi:hypothetical protein